MMGGHKGVATTSAFRSCDSARKHENCQKGGGGRGIERRRTESAGRQATENMEKGLT